MSCRIARHAARSLGEAPLTATLNCARGRCGELDGHDARISVSYGPLEATFTGEFSDSNRFAGGWRPNPGADESVNVPYDIAGTRP